MLCGMHVHVEFPDRPPRRVMARMLPYLPLFIALSASSPFWQGSVTGLKGYASQPTMNCPAPGCPSCSAATRNMMPMLMPWCSRARCGRQPSVVVDPAVAQISDTGAAGRGLLHPFDDTLALASLYRVVGPVPVWPCGAQRGDRRGDRAIAVENKWRAQRFGVQGSFIRSKRCRRRLSERDVQLIAPNAEVLACTAELDTLPDHRSRRHLGRCPVTDFYGK